MAPTQIMIDCHFTYHVAHTGGRETIQTSLDFGDGDDVQVFRTSVVGTVHDGRYGQTERDAELASTCSASSTLRHVGILGKGMNN